MMDREKELQAEIKDLKKENEELKSELRDIGKLKWNYQRKLIY